MKKNHLLLLVAMLSFSMLPACQNQNSSVASSEVSSSAAVIEKQLTVSQFPTTEYYQYETLDLSELEVTELTYADGKLSSSEVITDYVLTYDDGSLVQDKTVLLNASDDAINVNITKDGCNPTNFCYYVDSSSNFSQTLSVDSLPTKSMYLVNDTFDSTGLTISLRTNYKTTKSKKLTEVISGYTLKINSKEADGYQFSKVGIFTIDVTYQGWKTSLKTSFSVTVTNSLELEEYGTEEDTSISWKTNSEKMSVSLTNDTKETTEDDKGYYSPDEVDNKYNISSYRYKNAYKWHYTPSTGDVPLIVIPVVTPGDESKATSSNWNLIKKAFFGNSSELYFESLRSYYNKASFGQLNFKGCVTGYFNVSQYSNKLDDINNYTESNINALADLALQWVVDTYNINLTDYDSDHDGTVDGIWMINLHECSSGTNFWAFTTSTEEEGTVENPVANTYAWAGLDFLNDKYVDDYYGYSYQNKSCDAHVLIHETGHMLGLNDLYSYGYDDYDAVGKMDMMSNNLGDHNPYSKLLLGWIKPYIVYGNDVTISLESCQSQNSVIVIPYDDRTYKDEDGDGLIDFNVFDEYLLLDYYTPNNLNASDYDCYNAEHLNAKGGRLYHVDARLSSYHLTGNKVTLYSDPDEPFDGEHEDDELLLAITNSKSGTRSESYCWGWSSDTNAWDEIRWISADKTVLSSSNETSSSSLFKANASFDISSYSAQFNETELEDETYSYFNNEKTFNTSFKIDSIE